jgi:hypothetical protein
LHDWNGTMETCGAVYEALTAKRRGQSDIGPKQATVLNFCNETVVLKHADQMTMGGGARGARPALAAKTTTPSPPARACSVGGRPVVHGMQRAKAARHGFRTLRSREFEAAANDLARCQ